MSVNVLKTAIHFNFESIILGSVKAELSAFFLNVLVQLIYS